MLAEVVVASDGLSAEVAHEAAAAARHPVAALRLDQARPALDTLPHPSRRHALLTAARGETWMDSLKKTSWFLLDSFETKVEKAGEWEWHVFVPYTSVGKKKYNFTFCLAT